VSHKTQVNDHLSFQQKYSYSITAWQFTVIAKAIKAMQSKAVFELIYKLDKFLNSPN